jgi:hypothetical protein
MKEFSKALKVEAEVLKAELLSNERELCDSVWEQLIKETEKLSHGVEINPSEFFELITKEAHQRQWDLQFFRNYKNEPITNLFKKVIRQICKNEGVQLSNNALSRILNEVSRHYSSECILSAGLYPAEAFRKREEYGIPDDLGDTSSCFRPGGCNEGSALWLKEEYRNYQRAYLVVFHYQSGSKIGYGRCWAYVVPNAVYVTNFYSYRFEIKDDRFKKSIVRLIRRLFGLSENVKFSATGKNAPLPIYLNGDGIVIYEPSHYTHSEGVLDTIAHLKSRCLWCGDEVEINSLRKYDERIYYAPVEDRVNGLIVCSRCSYLLDDLVECRDCGALIYPEDSHYIEGVGYICDRCFENEWFYCDECEEPHRRDYGIVTPDGRWLCEYCASKIGAICAVCGEFHYFDDEENPIQQYEINRGDWLTDIHLCNKCAGKHLHNYSCQCGREVNFLDVDFRKYYRLRDMVKLGLCLDCYCKRQRDAHDFAFENREHPSLFTFSLDPGERVLREILSE